MKIIKKFLIQKKKMLERKREFAVVFIFQKILKTIDFFFVVVQEGVDERKNLRKSKIIWVWRFTIAHMRIYRLKSKYHYKDIG